MPPKQEKKAMPIDLEKANIRTFFGGGASSSSSSGAAVIPDGRTMMRRASGNEEGLGLLPPPFSPDKAGPDDEAAAKDAFLDLKRKRDQVDYREVNEEGEREAEADEDKKKGDPDLSGNGGGSKTVEFRSRLISAT